MKTFTSVLLRLFREEAKPHMRKLVGGTFCMVVVAITTAVMAKLMEPVIDKIFIERNKETLYTLSAAIFMTFLCKSVATFGESLWLGSVGQSVVVSLQKKLYRHILMLPYKFFQLQNSGNLVSRFIHDVKLLEGTVTQTFSSFVKDALTIIALAGLMLYYDWELALVSLVLFPIALLPLSRLAKRMRKTAFNIQSSVGEITSILTQSFQGIRVLKAYHVEGYESQKMSLILDGFLKKCMKGIKIKALSHPIMEFAGGVAIVVVITYWGHKIIHDQQSPGAFFAFITALLMMYEPAKRAAKLHTQLHESVVAAQRIYDILDLSLESQDMLILENEKSEKDGLTFQNVSFGFDSEKPILKNIHLHISSGETVAIVGPSGSGKTTLLNLILRLYNDYEGRIFWQSKDIQSYDLGALRSQLSLVSQEVTLFDDTIRANIEMAVIGLGKTVAQEDLSEVIKLAAADDFINQLPHGIDSLVGEMGGRLSGGQRQRIALARALLRQPKILMLDEATSALDSQSEKLIQENLEALRGKCTIIVIAHRLSTIQNADKIVLLNQGKIEAIGTHTHLIETSQLYQELCQHQFFQNT